VKEVSKMSMSELIARYNELASAKGVAPVTEFKNLAAARAAVTNLENANVTSENTAAEGTETQTAEGGAKYSTVGKRGPTQGVGAFAKDLLNQGMGTKEVLEAVLKQFPTAKTTASCIAYYKAALKNPNLGKRKPTVQDPEVLRAKAAELVAQADAIARAAQEAAAKEAAEAAAQAPAEAQA
jgi:hypothetical protein